MSTNKMRVYGMGAPTSPLLADIFMTDLENKIFNCNSSKLKVKECTYLEKICR